MPRKTSAWSGASLELELPIRPAAKRYPQGRYFVCHPGSSVERGMDSKRLPPAVFAELCARLHGAFGLPAVLVGGPEEKGLRASVQALAPGACVNPVTGSLEDVAGYIARAEFYLGNDSGLMHVAAALKVPCLAFFGPTDDRRNGPLGEGHLILRRDFTCSPCWSAANVGRRPGCLYHDFPCLQGFTAGEAWPRIEAHLRALGHPKALIRSEDHLWKPARRQSGKGIPK